MDENKKSFFERMGEILNAPLPGTERGAEVKVESQSGTNTSADVANENDDSLLARIKDILNTPLPGNDILEGQLVD